LTRFMPESPFTFGVRRHVATFRLADMSASFKARTRPRNPYTKANGALTHETASILVGLLWCMAILSVVVVGVLHTARMDLMVVKNYGDRIQAHYLALAGIEKARALLYHDAQDRSRTRKNHTGNYYDDEQEFRDVPFSRGTFSVLHRGRSDEGGGIIYGVSDEESRLNVNTATADELANLQNMTPDVATAIVNWRGGDNTTMAAEAQYYQGMQPPYQPRMGPYQTLRELLMVRGVSPDDFLGQDSHQNGLLAAADGNDFAFPGSVDSEDLGWAGILTVNSSVQNLNAAGEDRVNIQTADQSALTGIRGITPRIAQAIISYRGQHNFQSIADLLDVTPPQNQRGAGIDGSAQSGNSVVNEDLFMDIADDITTDNNQSLGGAININTAGVNVLVCLPGMTRELAQSIVSHRASGGFFDSTAELLKLPDMTRDIFKQIAPLITARSETYRILCEGKIKSTGVRQRIQATVHIGLNDQQILSWREDDL
jgi:DNA uptake protein ComE-like DNA-binding protein